MVRFKATKKNEQMSTFTVEWNVRVVSRMIVPNDLCVQCILRNLGICFHFYFIYFVMVLTLWFGIQGNLLCLLIVYIHSYLKCLTILVVIVENVPIHSHKVHTNGWPRQFSASFLRKCARSRLHINFPHCLSMSTATQFSHDELCIEQTSGLVGSCKLCKCSQLRIK